MCVAGKKSLSMLRLLVPSLHDAAQTQSSPSKEQEQFVSIAGIDLAGVPVAPFSASLLPGKPAGKTPSCCIQTFNSIYHSRPVFIDVFCMHVCCLDKAIC